MMATFEMQTIAQVSATRMVGCLLEGTLIAVLAWGASRLWQRESSGMRFAVWFSALMAIGASPFLSGLAGLHGATLSAAISHAPITLPGSWAIYFFIVWATIAGWLLLRVCIGLWHLQRIRKSFVPIDLEKLDPSIRETIERRRGSRTVSLCASDRVQVPAAIGLFSPVVVLPTWVLQELSAPEINQILLHELAHLRRRDDWTNLAQRVIKALFFFHPAVWWIEKKISLEREMACDDAVLAETRAPRAYAECLRRLAEKTLVRRSLAFAQAALGHLRQTSLRVARILNVNRRQGTTGAWKMAFPLTGLILAFAFSGMKEPQLIAFENGQPSNVHLRNGMASAAAPALLPSNNGFIRPAALRTSDEPTARSIPHSRKPRSIPAKYKGGDAIMLRRASADNAGSLVEKTVLVQTGSFAWSSSQVRANFVDTNLAQTSLAQVTDANAAQAIATEAVFFIVEDGRSGNSAPRAYEIQVWRLTLVHVPSNQVLHKEI